MIKVTYPHLRTVSSHMVGKGVASGLRLSQFPAACHPCPRWGALDDQESRIRRPKGLLVISSSIPQQRAFPRWSITRFRAGPVHPVQLIAVSLDQQDRAKYVPHQALHVNHTKGLPQPSRRADLDNAERGHGGT